MSAKHSTIPAGSRFGRLEVIGPETRRKGGICMPCRCDCGAVREFLAANLRHGRSRSCGCLQRERTSAANTVRTTTHGHTKGGRPSKAYMLWSRMRRRCDYEKGDNYANYGGRGIKVCDRWSGENGFANFFADMGEPPAGMSLDRIDPNGDYSKENCRWTTPKGQARNRRNNRLITFRDETKCLAEWAETYGHHTRTVWCRLSNGWSVEKALTTPLGGAKGA